jgi:hypothetical protein
MLYAPTAQAAGCPDELRMGDPQVAATSAGPQFALHTESAADEPCVAAGCACVCCHVHQAGGFPLTEAARLSAPSVRAATHRLADAPAPPSTPTFGLKRPPRA